MLGQNVNVGRGRRHLQRDQSQNDVLFYTWTIVEDDVFQCPRRVLTNVTNPHILVQRCGLSETTWLRRGATIGANATIVCGVTLGRNSFVAAGAVVT